MRHVTKTTRVFLLGIIVTFASSWPGFSQFIKKLPSHKPRLIVTIVIDPFSFDQLNRYQDRMGKDGFKRLINQGCFFRNARYNYFFTEPESGIATLATGANPDIHGITGASWFEPLHSQEILCTSDDQVTATGGSYDNGLHSPQKLLTSTIGDEIRLNSRFGSKVYSVSMDPESAVLLGGHLSNGTFWFDNVTGTWMSSSFYMDSLPEWVRKFNEKGLTDLYLQKSWETLLPLQDYTASLSDSSDTRRGIRNHTVFPYDLKKLSGARRKKENFSLIRFTPYANTLTKDFVTNLILEEHLGKDDTCDFLGVVFSANRYILKAFGPMSVEMEDAMLRLDRDIAGLLTFLDEEVGKENVLVVLTASRGITPDPTYMQTLRMPSGYFNPNQAMALLRSYMNVIYGEGKWVKGYHNHQVYLNHTLIEDANLSLYNMQDRIADFMIQFTGVNRVMTGHALRESGNAGDLFLRVQNGYFPKRSGDLFIILDPGWKEKAGEKESNGTGFWYDSHVPLIWYGWKIPRKVIYHPVDLTSVAPTLSFFLNIPAPNGSEGKLLEELLEIKAK